MDIQTIRQKLERKKGQADQIRKDLAESKRDVISLKKEISYSEKASSIISAVAKETQEEFSYRIEAPISLALAAVYPENPYKMVAKFEVTGRGTTECHLDFERDGNLINPLDASGGGPVDVASFALRVSAWSLAQPRSRAILVLDEPFKWVSRNKIALAGQMLHALSDQLNLQVIVVSHIPELIDTADRIIEVSIEDGVSQVHTKEVTTVNNA